MFYYLENEEQRHLDFLKKLFNKISVPNDC